MSGQFINDEGVMMIKRCALVLLLAAGGWHFASAGISFLRGSLHDAIARAEKERKPVMIDFITDWCRWCDTLDARTYSDPRVADFVNQNVVPIKIDAEKGEGIGIAGKYGVHAYPTILLIRPDGEEIDRLLGYVQADPFLNSIHDYVNGINTLASLQSTLNIRPDDASLHYALAGKYRDRDNWKLSADHYQKVLDLDSANVLGHNEEAQYSVGLATFRASKDPAKLDAFIERYPGSPMVREALYALWRTYVKSKDGTNARKYFSQYMTMRPGDAAMMNNYAWGCAEQRINLDHARDVAKKAVDLAATDSDRAVFLDTQATVEFAGGNLEEAIHLEQEALDLLTDATPKQRKDYEESMAKFKAGLSARTQSPGKGTESGTGDTQGHSGTKQATGK